jgi:hypothetical protein
VLKYLFGSAIRTSINRRRKHAYFFSPTSLLSCSVVLQNPRPDVGVGDRTTGLMCIYLHETTTTDSDPLQSAAEAGAWARRAPGPACSESCTMQSTAEELLPTTTSILHSFICRPHMKSNISLSIHHCISMSNHFSLVPQWCDLHDGELLIHTTSSYLSDASSSTDARARHHYSGRAHISVSPWPRAREPGCRMRPWGADWCSPASKSKQLLPFMVRTRASLAETHGCRVVQSRSRLFFHMVIECSLCSIYS